MSLINQYQTRAEETPEGRERLQAYHCALGKFVDTFAQVEAAAHLTLRHYGKLSTAAGRVLLSGVRVDETRNRLQRLFEAGLVSAVDWDDAAAVFQQLGVINSRRNDILHHGASDVPQGFGFVSNERMAHTPDKAREFSISPEILDDMTADLRTIMLRLFTRHMGRPVLARLRGLEDFLSARSLSINELTEKVFTTEVSRTSRR